MAFPPNKQLRDRLRARCLELEKIAVIGDLSPAKQLATEFGMSYQMVCYYLRSKNTHKKTDSRRAYTARELTNLDLMTAAERRAFAEATHRTARAVDAALERWRKSMREYIRTEYQDVEQSEIQDMRNNNFFNMGHEAHLRSNNLSHDQVIAAKALLHRLYGLSLRAPNILYHPASKRRYLLNTVEERLIIENPKRFLREHAGEIKEGWAASDNDPVDDPQEGRAEVSYPVNYSYTKAQAVWRKEFRQTTAKLSELIAGRHMDEGTAVYNTLVEMQKRIASALTPEPGQAEEDEDASPLGLRQMTTKTHG